MVASTRGSPYESCSSEYATCHTSDPERICNTQCIVFFQAEDGIRYLVRSRGLGDVYKRQVSGIGFCRHDVAFAHLRLPSACVYRAHANTSCSCLLYTSDAADERSSVDLGGRRIIKKKKEVIYRCQRSGH